MLGKEDHKIMQGNETTAGLRMRPEIPRLFGR
jgi:hypothetical protein